MDAAAVTGDGLTHCDNGYFCFSLLYMGRQEEESKSPVLLWCELYCATTTLIYKQRLRKWLTVVNWYERVNSLSLSIIKSELDGYK